MTPQEKLEHKKFLTQKKKVFDDFLLCYVQRDFRLFCSYLKIYTKDSKNPEIPFSFENWHAEQKKFDQERTGRDIILKPRQIGISSIELARDLFFALTHKGARVLIVAHDNPTKLSLMNDLKVFLNELKNLKAKWNIDHILPEILSENTTEIHFDQVDSWIQVKAAGQNTTDASGVGRGISVARLHLTEFAYWQHPEETWGSIWPTAKDDVECVIESTANGTNNKFYEMFNQGKDGTNPFGFKSHFFPWIDHQRYSTKVPNEFPVEAKNDWEKMFIEKHQISKEQLLWWQNQSADMGLEKMLSEYPIDDFSAFRNSNTNKFLTWEDETHLNSIIISPIKTEKIFGVWQLDIFQLPDEKKKYIISGDIAGGHGNDYSVLYVFDRESWDMVAHFASNIIEPHDFADLLDDVGKMFHDAMIVWEVNNHGHAVTWKLLKNQYPNLYSGVFSSGEKIGFKTNVRSRDALMGLLVELVRKRMLNGIDGTLYYELKNFGLKDDKLQGLNGVCDDHVMAFLIGMKILEMEGLNRVKDKITTFRYATFGKRDFNKNTFF